MTPVTGDDGCHAGGISWHRIRKSRLVQTITSSSNAPTLLASVPSAMSVARFEALLRRSRLLTSLGPDAVREAARAATAKRYEKGERIWRAGNTATHFQVVISGIVKLVAPGPGLRPTIVDVFGPGESLGYWAAFDSSPYIGDAMPVTDRVETLLIPATVLHQLTRANPEAALAMTHAVLAYARALRAKIAVMCAGTVHQRLAMLLLDLAARFGDESDDGTTLLPVPLSRLDLAMCVGATIETVIRAMSRWQKQGVLETLHSGFVLRDVPQLQALLEGVPLPRAEERSYTLAG